MDKRVEHANQIGLLDVIKEWIKEEKYITASRIQRDFSVGFMTATSIFNYLIEENLVEKEPTYKLGHKVIIYTPHNPMEIYLIDVNDKVIRELRKEFLPYDNVKVIKDTFSHFMDTHKKVECIVSPGNAFGYMDGGYDKAIIDYYGEELEEKVQSYIRKNQYGEQPVGTSIIVDFGSINKKLIHTVTMRLPSPIKDSLIVYQCMRTTLMTAIDNKVQSIVIPAFGGATGKVNPSIIAKYIRLGYEQVMDYLNHK